MHTNHAYAKYILIGDEQPKAGFFLRSALERHNRAHRVTIVHSGQEVLQILGASAVDVPATDLRMPGTGALELTGCARVACTLTAYLSRPTPARRSVECSR